MEEEQERQSRRIQKMTEKYQIGNANKGGAAYNIINLGYEQSKEGEYLKQRDYDQQVRTWCAPKTSTLFPTLATTSSMEKSEEMWIFLHIQFTIRQAHLDQCLERQELKYSGMDLQGDQ